MANKKFCQLNLNFTNHEEDYVWIKSRYLRYLNESKSIISFSGWAKLVLLGRVKWQE